MLEFPENPSSLSFSTCVLKQQQDKVMIIRTHNFFFLALPFTEEEAWLGCVQLAAGGEAWHRTCPEIESGKTKTVLVKGLWSNLSVLPDDGTPLMTPGDFQHPPPRNRNVLGLSYCL